MQRKVSLTRVEDLHYGDPPAAKLLISAGYVPAGCILPQFLRDRAPRIVRGSANRC